LQGCRPGPFAQLGGSAGIPIPGRWTKARQEVARFNFKHLIRINNLHVTKAYQIKNFSMKILHNFRTVAITAYSEIVMPAKNSHSPGHPP
jgi:hypothetical protein